MMMVPQILMDTDMDMVVAGLAMRGEDTLVAMWDDEMQRYVGLAVSPDDDVRTEMMGSRDEIVEWLSR